MIDIQIKPQIKAIKLIIDHERDQSIAQGGYLDTCRDYRLPSLNFGKKPKCPGIYLGNIQKSIAKASKSVSTRFLPHGCKFQFCIVITYFGTFFGHVKN